MSRHVRKIVLLTIAILSVVAQAAPFSFRSQQHPNSLLIKVEVEPEQELRVKSPTLMPGESHWTTLHTFGPDIASEPVISHSSILFNEKHEGKYNMAFYDGSVSEPASSKKFHFNYLETDQDGEVTGWLLPRFRLEMPAFRIDRVFRCAETLVSVEWKENDAHVVAFSKSGHQWSILESIDGGHAGEDEGVRYAYAIDQQHEKFIVVNIGTDAYCQIGRKTVPAKVQSQWSSELYTLQSILDLVGDELELKAKGKPIEEEL